MTNDRLSRRQLVAGALVGAAAMVLQSSSGAAEADTETLSPKTGATEGELLTSLVPVNAGYQLTETQTKEVPAQLKDYPGGFAVARKRAIPDDVAPAFIPSPPRPVKRGKK